MKSLGRRFPPLSDQQLVELLILPNFKRAIRNCDIVKMPRFDPRRDGAPAVREFYQWVADKAGLIVIEY